MNISFNTPYFIMLIIGVIDGTLLLIFDIITFSVNPDNDGIIKGFNDSINNIGKVFALILYLILKFFQNLGFWLTIYYYSPCHTFISEYISNFVFYVKEVIKKEDEFYSTKTNAIIFIISYIFITFFMLIFNEVIIINICRMDYYKKKELEKEKKLT